MPWPAARQTIPMCVAMSWLLNPTAVHGRDRMAAIAALTVFAQVPVILAVTAAAQRRGLHRARRFVMTIGALQFGVGAEQRKAIGSVLRMIERPQRPTIG